MSIREPRQKTGDSSLGILIFGGFILAMFIYTMDQTGMFDDPYWYYSFPFAEWILGDRPYCGEFSTMIWHGDTYDCQINQIPIGQSGVIQSQESVKQEPEK